MKSRKLLWLFLPILAIGVVGYLWVKHSHTDKPVVKHNWNNEIPRVLHNAGYVAELEESAPRLLNLSESLDELRGPITNPFGIRDDILEYIMTNIPKDNESAIRAAIKEMQYDQAVYFDNPSGEEALRLDAKSALADSCLMTYMNTDTPLAIWRVMRNTDARDKYMWAIDRKYFSWKVLGTGLTIDDEEIACEKGAF
jgi:hypothetical protein